MHVSALSALVHSIELKTILEQKERRTRARNYQNESENELWRHEHVHQIYL